MISGSDWIDAVMRFVAMVVSKFRVGGRRRSAASLSKRLEAAPPCRNYENFSS
ncbi:MAG: hypothetical protein ACJAR2_004359 [Ilumatobacter sp.]